NQDLAERLKIQNVQTGAGQSDFSRAIGLYFVNGNIVRFLPRLPEEEDRSDAGLRANGNYHVFLKGGGDGLRSSNGDRIPSQQEFLFDTNTDFEDIIPNEPPRALGLIARDTVNQTTFDISRLDPRPGSLETMSSNDLLSATDAGGLPAPRAIEPGAGGAPNFASPWQFELSMSEPLDPATVTTANVTMLEIRNDALDTATTAAPNRPEGLGTQVNGGLGFRVPIAVKVIQRHDPATGALTVFVQVTPQQTLVDDARYRIIFSGDILGIDRRKTFIGNNGLTGDGQTPLSSLSQAAVFEEPGGIGYVSEFLVFDRPGITATRTVTYDPLVDGVNPELGQTTLDEDVFNSALYNPVSDPGKAVGVIGSFGQGDVDFAVSGAQTKQLDTGDMPNAVFGNPFTSDDPDLDPTDTYKNTTGLPTPGFVQFPRVEATEFQFGSFTVSSSSTVNIIGVNPCRIICTGLVTITGTVNAAGGDGGPGFQTAGNNVSTTPGFGGTAGPGGWAGGEGSSPQSTFQGS
ncbi:MAG: hypothetical protein ACE5GT_15440, partial [Rhodospirillales bacterium]